MEVSDSEQEKKPTLDQTMLKDIQDQDQLQVLVLKLVDLPQATTMSDKRDIWRNMQKVRLYCTPVYEKCILYPMIGQEHLKTGRYGEPVS